MSEEWRLRHTSLPEQLWYMFQNDIETDLHVYLVNDQKQKVYRCHKMILLRLSSVFQTLIQGFDRVEGEECYISISAIEPSLFELVLRFAYTDKAELESVKKAMVVRDFCTKFNIQTLHKECVKFIATCQITPDSVWDILDCPNRDKKLEKKLLKFVSSNTAACLAAESFLGSSQASLARVLAMDSLALDSEVQLVEAAVRWARVRNDDRPLDPETAQRLLGPCLPLLRFLALSPAHFSSRVAAAGLFSPEDSLRILVNLTSPGQMPLPPYICPLDTNRITPPHPPLPQPQPKQQKQLNKQKETESKRQEVVCFRGRCHPLEAQDWTVSAPVQFELGFRVNKRVLLTRVRFVAQVNTAAGAASSYREAMHVSVVKVDGAAKKQPIAFHSLFANTAFGPGGVVDVTFSTPGVLDAATPYLLKVNIKSTGHYLCHVRGSEVHVQGLVVNFDGHEKCPHAGLVHSFVFQV